MKEPGDDVRPEQDRDRALDELLRQALTAEGATAPAGACLDAETAAAWMEDSLQGGERDAVEAHVSGCPRCQALLGAIVRTETAPEPARGWWKVSPMRWLMPAGLTAAVALAVFLLLPNDAGRNEPRAEGQVARSEPAQGSHVATETAPSASVEADDRKRPAAPPPGEPTFRAERKAFEDGTRQKAADRERASVPSSAQPALQGGKRESEEVTRQDAAKELRQRAAAADEISTRAKDVR